MSDFDALNQLFRLNPDSPQAHMLSAQELQDDLALWGSVQFQLEPMSEEQQLHSQDKALKSLSSPAMQSSVDMVSAAKSASAWNSFMHIHAQEPLSPQGNPLDFMMGGATTTDFLSALAAAPITPQQWAQFAQQPPNTPAFASSVPIASQLLGVVPAADASKQVADISATPAFRYPTIIPKATLPTATPVVTASTTTATTTTTTTSRRASAKAKQTTLVPATAHTNDAAEDEKADYGEDGHDPEETGDGRQKAASDDKRRRNTAASARFRVKKKLKEQALERSAREMEEKAAALEKRVQELETETRWLKSLVIDKDPNLLSNIRCPCHHPNGLDLSKTTSASAHHSLNHSYHRHGLGNLQPAHQYIVPAPALPSSSSIGEPPLKRPKV
ncbi:hypothetical protein IW152_005194 [Coemansia sp. BCRC 34962]|nr:hypothetical protein IW152_005194 [Coemansia sp. BCRC 34962]